MLNQFPCLDKNTLRQQMLNRRSFITAADKRAFEKEASFRLTQLTAFQNAEIVMAYMDFREEAPTGGLIETILERKKKLVLPYTSQDFHIIPYLINPIHFKCQLKSSPMGILEPDPNLCKAVEPEKIDLVLVPGVVFDRQGHRIGYGKGCYDQFLPKLRETAVFIGVAYDFQILPSIPCDPLDVKLHALL